MKQVVFRSCHISMTHIEFDQDYNYFEKEKKNLQQTVSNNFLYYQVTIQLPHRIPKCQTEIEYDIWIYGKK